MNAYLCFCAQTIKGTGRNAGKIIHIFISDDTAITSVGYVLTLQIRNINHAHMHLSCIFFSPADFELHSSIFQGSKPNAAHLLFNLCARLQCLVLYGGFSFHFPATNGFFPHRIDKIANKCQSNPELTFSKGVPGCLNVFVPFGRAWDCCGLDTANTDN